MKLHRIKLTKENISQNQFMNIGIDIADAFIRAKLCKTKSEVRRAIENKAIKIQDITIENVFTRLAFDSKTNNWFILELE